MNEQTVVYFVLMIASRAAAYLLWLSDAPFRRGIVAVILVVSNMVASVELRRRCGSQLSGHPLGPTGAALRAYLTADCNGIY